MRALKYTKRGFTLIELMIVVVIVGILAALAIYGVSRYMLNSKTAEARNSLGQMGKDGVTAYQREGMAPAVLALGGETGVVNVLCPTAAKVPVAATDIQGQKHQSSPVDWNGVGWSCLKFSMDAPQYYQYGYTLTGPGNVVGNSFLGTAEGDLDGDGTLSLFSIKADIQEVGGQKVVTLAPNLSETNPEE